MARDSKPCAHEQDKAIERKSKFDSYLYYFFQACHLSKYGMIKPVLILSFKVLILSFKVPNGMPGRQSLRLILIVFTFKETKQRLSGRPIP